MAIVDVDPDPTPTATAWQEYLAAAQSLDAVHRAAAAAGAADAAGAPAGTEWPELGQRLDQQRARLTGEAVRCGLPAPQLTPTAPELAAAREATAAITAAITAPAAAETTDPEAATEQVAAAVLWQCRSLLDACDAQLAAPASPRRSRRPAGSPLLVFLAGVAALLTSAGLVLLILLLTG